MEIYKKEKRFDQLTGEPKFIKIYKETRCDYSGEIIDDDYIYCTYRLNYGSSDPCFGSWSGEVEFKEKYNVYLYPFLFGDYVFLQDYDAEIYPEKEMMEKFKGNCFHEMCRRARIETATRLIEGKIITPEQLSYDLEQ